MTDGKCKQKQPSPSENRYITPYKTQTFTTTALW
jgi:hypothetical protein